MPLVRTGFADSSFLKNCNVINLVLQGNRTVTLKKLECLKQAYAVNTLAWNNNLGLRFYFVGF